MHEFHPGLRLTLHDPNEDAVQLSRPGDECETCGGGPCQATLPPSVPPIDAPWWSHEARESWYLKRSRA